MPTAQITDGKVIEDSKKTTALRYRAARDKPSACRVRWRWHVT